MTASHHVLQQAAYYRLLKSFLKSSIFVLIFSGICNIILFMFRQNDISVFTIIILEILIFIQIILNLTITKPYVYISFAILCFILTVIQVLLAFMSIKHFTVFNNPSIYISLSGWQLGIAFAALRLYKFFKYAPDTAPPIAMVRALNETATTIRTLKPNDDPHIIEFRIQLQKRSSVYVGTWRGRLEANGITLVNRTGTFLCFLKRDELIIIPDSHHFQGTFMAPAQINIGTLALRGMIDYTSYDRFFTWQHHDQPAQQGVWVPQTS